jgi:riboflavin biosynthesis pyrimidine reductase
MALKCRPMPADRHAAIRATDCGRAQSLHHPSWRWPSRSDLMRSMPCSSGCSPSSGRPLPCCRRRAVLSPKTKLLRSCATLDGIESTVHSALAPQAPEAVRQGSRTSPGSTPTSRGGRPRDGGSLATRSPVFELSPFQHFAAHKTRDAAAASIARLSTVFDRRDSLRVRVRGIGNAWSRLHYGGDFGLVRASRPPAISLVFVQTQDGNTGGSDPSAFGGGATDTHLIYEGLSRVAADAVLAGARSVHRDAFFSVWHPDLVALRASLGLARHPAQLIVSSRGRLNLAARLFNVPEVRVILIAGDECIARQGTALRTRPWVRVLPLGGGNLGQIFERLQREEGIQRISAIGGRSTATQLVDARLVQDIYLTTTSLEGGEPGTSWYCGRSSPQLTAITRKQWHDNGRRVVFDHFLITSHRESSSEFRQPGV